MRRLLASPEADTPSYWPVCISWTISSDVLPIFTFTLQPESVSNFPTQFTLGSLAPLSAYPAQAMMSSCPSPAPMAACAVAVVLASVSLELVLLLLLPQPIATSAIVAVTAIAAVYLRVRCLVLVLVLVMLPPRVVLHWWALHRSVDPWAARER